jgi:hypothetical protein
MYLNSQVRVVDVRDGTSHTIILGEKQCGPNDLGWMSGTRSTLRNAGTPINATGPNDIASGDPPEADDVTIVSPDHTKQLKKDSNDENVLAMNTIVAAAPIQPITWVGGFGSWHSGGVAIFGLGDGAVRTFTEDMDPEVLRRMAHRADGHIEQGVPEW